jgi:hypothetical protein
MTHKAALAATVLLLGTFSGMASAADSLASRAASALSVVIASQGDAALVQIRRELKESALEAMRPFLPEAPAPEPQTPAATPVAQR